MRSAVQRCAQPLVQALLSPAAHRRQQSGPCHSCCRWFTLIKDCVRRRCVAVQGAKQLHFNKDGEAMKRMQAGVDKLATVVGVTLGPKVLLCGAGSQQTSPCGAGAQQSSP